MRWLDGTTNSYIYLYLYLYLYIFLANSHKSRIEASLKRKIEDVAPQSSKDYGSWFVDFRHFPCTPENVFRSLLHILKGDQEPKIAMDHLGKRHLVLLLVHKI